MRKNPNIKIGNSVLEIEISLPSPCFFSPLEKLKHIIKTNILILGECRRFGQ